MFNSYFASPVTVTSSEFIISSAIALAMGLIIALIHCYKNVYSKNMIITLIVLPIIIQAVFMVVNGRIGIGEGIAAGGAFSIIRFRSQPANSRELTSILLSTVIGIALARGYFGVAGLLLVVVSLVIVIAVTLGIGEIGVGKHLRITIPENMDYEGVFDDIFEKYASKYELMKVKTVNMGSLYELDFNLTMKKEVSEKEFIDQIRCRNGNLNVILSKITSPKDEL